MVRVDIPRNPEALLALAETICTRDAELGERSPLGFLNWSEKAPQLDEAIAAHEEAEALRRQMEAAYEKRDKLVKDATTWVRQSRDILTGVYRDEMRKLGDYGFTVDGSPR